MKKIAELRKLDNAKLQQELKDASKNLFEIRFSVESGQGRNVADISKWRKYVARIKTLLKEENKLEKVA